MSRREEPRPSTPTAARDLAGQRAPCPHESLVCEQSAQRKPYRSPELVEWGSIVELTRGTRSGFQDFPAPGGSEGF